MQKIICSILILMSIMACQTTSKNLGEKFEPRNTVSVHNVVERLKTEPVVNNVQIEGKIAKSCMSEGCWFTIKDDSTGNEILFDVKDKKFRVPINSPEKQVIVLADALKDSTSEQKFTLSVKGLMFK
ncbi:MAG: DUF4920 domain-containing protein [Chitinophagales bacterium]